MAKKRKDAGQSNTLDGFFAKAGSSSNKKPKLRPGTIAPAKAKKIPFNISPEEIIVIDSDDDDSRNPMIIDDSSDVEILDETQTALSAASGSKLKATKAGASATAAQNSSKTATVSDNHETAIESVDDDNMSFGEPSLLVEATAGAPRTRATEDAFDFGLPTLLHGRSEELHSSTSANAYEPADDALLLDDQGHAQQDVPAPRTEPEDCPRRPSPHPLQRSDSKEDLLQEGTSLMQRPVATTTSSSDQWELGDDEAAVLGADLSPDDAEQADVELSLNEDADRGDVELVQTCPICDVLLDKLSALVSVRGIVTTP